MEALNSFYDECNEDGVNVKSDVTTADESEVINNSNNDSSDNDNNDAGYALIGGCHDLQKLKEGLDGIHVLNPNGSTSIETDDKDDNEKEQKIKATAINSYTSAYSNFFFLITKGETDSDDNKLYAMGRNESGQLGLNDNINRTQLTEVIFDPTKCQEKIKDIIKITTGKSHSLILFKSGYVYASGSNEFGQLGGIIKDGSGNKITTFTCIEKLKNDVADIASGNDHNCICTKQGRLYTFGHPEYCQLGDGENGECIERAGKLSYRCVNVPQLIRNFVKKDRKNKIESKYDPAEIFIIQVACGKNHTIVLEKVHESGAGGRVFTFGCGGYGRLGHNCVIDEPFAREITHFSNDFALRPNLAIKTIGGGIFNSYAINKSGVLFFWGTMPRKDACIYPKVVEAVEEHETIQCQLGNGYTLVLLSDGRVVGYGIPAASGRLGFPGNAGMCARPSFMDGVNDIVENIGNVSKISAGNAHAVYIVNHDNQKSDESSKKLRKRIKKLKSMPVLPVAMPIEKDTKGKGGKAKAKKATTGKATKGPVKRK